jgi:hypothetical protein
MFWQRSFCLPPCSQFAQQVRHRCKGE